MQGRMGPGRDGDGRRGGKWEGMDPGKGWRWGGVEMGRDEGGKRWRWEGWRCGGTEQQQNWTKEGWMKGRKDPGRTEQGGHRGAASIAHGCPHPPTTPPPSPSSLLRPGPSDPRDLPDPLRLLQHPDPTPNLPQPRRAFPALPSLSQNPPTFGGCSQEGDPPPPPTPPRTRLLGPPPPNKAPCR